MTIQFESNSVGWLPELHNMLLEEQLFIDRVAAGFQRLSERFRLSLDELAAIQEQARRYLARAWRPAPLVRRQWYRPRWVTRACGSRHRVMLG